MISRNTFRAQPFLTFGGNGNVWRTNPSELAAKLGELKKLFGLTILGGCCGTDAEHLQSIAAASR